MPMLMQVRGVLHELSPARLSIRQPPGLRVSAEIFDLPPEISPGGHTEAVVYELMVSEQAESAAGDESAQNQHTSPANVEKDVETAKLDESEPDSESDLDESQLVSESDIEEAEADYIESRLEELYIRLQEVMHRLAAALGIDESELDLDSDQEVLEGDESAPQADESALHADESASEAQDPARPEVPAAGSSLAEGGALQQQQQQSSSAGAVLHTAAGQNSAQQEGEPEDAAQSQRLRAWASDPWYEAAQTTEAAQSGNEQQQQQQQQQSQPQPPSSEAADSTADAAAERLEGLGTSTPGILGYVESELQPGALNVCRMECYRSRFSPKAASIVLKPAGRTFAFPAAEGRDQEDGDADPDEEEASSASSADAGAAGSKAGSTQQAASSTAQAGAEDAAPTGSDQPTGSPAQEQQVQSDGRPSGPGSSASTEGTTEEEDGLDHPRMTLVQTTAYFIDSQSGKVRHTNQTMRSEISTLAMAGHQAGAGAVDLT